MSCLRTLIGQSALPRLETQMLWQHVLDVPRVWLITHDTDPLSDDAVAHYRRLESRRLQGEPMAYILGQREFMGHTFHVTPDVLIPRPETELLVETALKAIQDLPAPRVLDLGTGSGAIAVSIALARSDAIVVATDVSAAALDVAACNAQRLKAPVSFLPGSWYDALSAHADFDVIVSNPPYIAVCDRHLTQGDVRFEPAGALSDGGDGLGALRAIVSDSPSHLRAGGSLFLEHGWDQAEAVRHLLQQVRYTRIESLSDLAGIERVTGGYLPISTVEKA